MSSTAPNARRHREEILRRVDLAELLGQLGRARGLEHRGKQFPCPEPAHEQTGKTPPVSITATAESYELWKCHGCDAGGTAIDALIVAGRALDAKAALEQLGDGDIQLTRSKPPPRRAPNVEALPSEADLARWAERLVTGSERLKGWSRETVEAAGMG
jgi:hypothetical protein